MNDTDAKFMADTSQKIIVTMASTLGVWILGILAKKIYSGFQKISEQKLCIIWRHDNLLLLITFCCLASSGLVGLIYMPIFFDTGNIKHEYFNIIGFRVDPMMLMWYVALIEFIVIPIPVIRSFYAKPNELLRLKGLAVISVLVVCLAMEVFLYFFVKEIPTDIRIYTDKFPAVLAFVFILIASVLLTRETRRAIKSGQIKIPNEYSPDKIVLKFLTFFSFGLSMVFFLGWYLRAPYGPFPAWMAWICLFSYSIAGLAGSIILLHITLKNKEKNKIRSFFSIISFATLSITSVLFFGGIISGRIPPPYEGRDMIKEAHSHFKVRPSFIELKNWIDDYYNISKTDIDKARTVSKLDNEMRKAWYYEDSDSSNQGREDFYKTTHTRFSTRPSVEELNKWIIEYYDIAENESGRRSMANTLAEGMIENWESPYPLPDR
jgi:hypothetical protein